MIMCIATGSIALFAPEQPYVATFRYLNQVLAIWGSQFNYLSVKLFVYIDQKLIYLPEIAIKCIYIQISDSQEL